MPPGFWAIGVGLAIFCLAPVGCFVAGAVATRRALAPTTGCALTLDALRGALRGYAEAHDGRLPPAATWQTDLAPYYDRARAGAFRPQRSDESPRADEPWECQKAPEATALVFNAALGGRKISELTEPERQVVVFEAGGAAEVNRNAAFDPARVGLSPKTFGMHRAWYGISAAFEQLDIWSNGAVAPTSTPSPSPPDSM